MGLDVHALEDFRVPHAWFPRPAPTVDCGNYRSIFRHPTDPQQGNPMPFCDATPIAEKGRRRQWRYMIKYPMGDEVEFILPCPSLPFNLTRQSVIDRVKLSVRQEMKKDRHAKLRVIKSNINQILIHRNKADDIPLWDKFFESLPSSNEQPHHTYRNSLEELAQKFGGLCSHVRSMCNLSLIHI